ncbi:MAG TPA: hypothetical protein VGC90_09955, partial [Candidatus Limnocylindrales bacterium]
MRTVARASGTLALAIALAVVGWIAPSPSPFSPGPAQAAGCKSGGHSITLDRGGASPASGTTATTFRFSVRYRDSGGCSANAVSVTIPGVGTFPLAGGGTSWTSGVTFSRTTKLPVGSWSYYFTATSGSGGGTRFGALGSVVPTRVVVTAPKPTP